MRKRNAFMDKHFPQHDKTDITTFCGYAATLTMANPRPDQPPRLQRAHGSAVRLPSLLAEPSESQFDRGSLH